MIFMDVRMPPGMDGIRASAKIWENHPDIEIVICTAHSDYTWGEMVKEIGASDKLQFLRKPFDMVTVQQMALACLKRMEAREQEERQRLQQQMELADHEKIGDQFRTRCQDMNAHLAAAIDALAKLEQCIHNPDNKKLVAQDGDGAAPMAELTGRVLSELEFVRKQLTELI
jgi:DNA-binding NtrC family response regulator